MRGLGIASMVLVTLLVAGCAPAPARKVVGTWVVDQQQGMLGLLAKTGMTIKFAADGALTISGGAPGATISKNGTWRFLEAKDRSVVLETSVDGAQPVRLNVTVVDDNTIRMVPPSMPAALEVTFKRAT